MPRPSVPTMGYEYVAVVAVHEAHEVRVQNALTARDQRLGGCTWPAQHARLDWPASLAGLAV